MYAPAEKYHSGAKKITQFKFSSFQENILCKDNRYLLKKKINRIIVFLSDIIDVKQ